MKDQVYLAVDLGAESGRVIAGLWDGKQMRLEPVHRFANEPVEIAGSLRWDVPRLVLEIQNGLQAAGGRHGGKVVSVGVDTWGVDFALLSKTGELLGLPHHYRDTRTRGMLDEALRRVPRAEIFAQTGLQFMEINTLYQLLALQKNSPEILAAADCLLMMPDFFHWCLSGEKNGEFTEATTSQLFHPVSRAWAGDLLARFNLPPAIFPEVVMPGTRLGALRPSIAASTGLGAIAVVAPPSHDTASAVAAVPAAGGARGNWAFISSGTWSLMGMELPAAQLSPKVLEWNLSNEGGVDGAYNLQKNIMGLWLVQQCKRAFAKRSRELDYPELVRLAQAAPGMRSFVDPGDARFLNPPDMPGAIQDFCRSAGQPIPETEGALVRCALESLALAYHETLTALEEVTGSKVSVIHIGGGGSRNDLLNQFTANACGRNVLAGPEEATALGNLLIQARASGGIASLAELRAIVGRSAELKSFDPESSNAAAWSEARNRFASLRSHERAL